MNDYALVLNAGSSSLKFSIYGRQESGSWALASRGQVEGIGTTPQFSAKDSAGAVLDRKDLGGTVRDARGLASSTYTVFS